MRHFVLKFLFFFCDFLIKNWSCKRASNVQVNWIFETGHVVLTSKQEDFLAVDLMFQWLIFPIIKKASCLQVLDFYLKAVAVPTSQ